MFRNRPAVPLRGRLHEQIAQRLPGYLPERLRGERGAHRALRLSRRGARQREKSRRNIELLRLQQAESPPTPFLHYNLGSEYAAAGDAPAALAEFERAWALLEADPDARQLRVRAGAGSRLVKALRVCGRPQEAIARAEDGLRALPGLHRPRLRAGDGDDRARASATARSSYYERCIEMGDARSATPRRSAAAPICRDLRSPSCRPAQRRGRAGARAAASTACASTRGFIGAVLPYASALLADGVEPGRGRGARSRQPCPSRAGGALHARHGAVRGGAAGRRGPVPGRARAPAALRPRARRARRGPARPAPLRRGGRGRGRRALRRRRPAGRVGLPHRAVRAADRRRPTLAGVSRPRCERAARRRA